MIEQLPIAETFHSIQGEGTYVGTAMHFIRLAGCSVGKKASDNFLKISHIAGDNLSLPILQNGKKGSKCQTWDGRFFDCDTDFSIHTYKTVDELITDTYEEHICLTGGEPLNHQTALIRYGFFAEAFARKIQVHIETSGTVMIDEALKFDPRVWITVSPKMNYIPEMLLRASEVKLLVDDKFDVTEFNLISTQKNVFLSPINGEKEVNQANVKIARDIQKKYVKWRLSCQWHKFLGGDDQLS